MSQDDDRYLFEGTGAPDADVERLERVLRPLGRREDAPVTVTAPRRRTRLLLFGAIAAAAAAAVLVAVATRGTDAPRREEPKAATGPSIRDANADAAFGVGAWVETADAPREILVGDLGRVELAARSRLRVEHVSDETTRLYLARGALEAFVGANARPRFFQVDTDAARCVDLGCRYTLTVDDRGDARVRVLTGQVAFETETREVFVPAGATCAAAKGRGPGTPRFEDARDEVVRAFDAYDAAPAAERRGAAQTALSSVRDARDALAAWHLLQDADAEIARAADARLAAVAGPLPDSAGDAAVRRAAWKERLAESW